jgi:ankyrin repeat protein
LFVREAVELLLAHEASVNIVDSKGSSPLHLAAWSGNEDVVRLLLCRGPSVPKVNLTVSIYAIHKHVQQASSPAAIII